MSQQTGGKGEESEFFFGSDAFVPSEETKEENNLVVEESADKTIHKPKKDFKKSLVSNIFEWLDVVVASVVVVVILFTFVFRMVAIDGHSMNNTLFNGERVIISNMFYEPERGDIVVISRNSENASESDRQPIIKRVIALENDLVDIKNGKVYVNNVPLKEEYALGITEQIDEKVKFPLVVKENCVFVLGDNRNNSRDSRSSSLMEDDNNGQVNVKYILGRAIFRIFPLNKFGGID